MVAIEVLAYIVMAFIVSAHIGCNRSFAKDDGAVELLAGARWR